MSRTAKLFRLLVLTSAFFLLFASKTVITYAAFTDSETIDSDLQLRSGYLSLADIGSPFNDGLEGTVDQTASKKIAIKNSGTLQGTVSYSVTSGTSDWSEYVNISDTGHFNGQVLEPNASISPQLTVKVIKDWTSEEPLVLTVKVRLQQVNAKGSNGFFDEKNFTIKISKTQKQPEEQWPLFSGNYFIAQDLIFNRVDNGKVLTIQPGIIYFSSGKNEVYNEQTVATLKKRLSENLKGRTGYARNILYEMLDIKYIPEKGFKVVLKLRKDQYYDYPDRLGFNLDNGGAEFNWHIGDDNFGHLLLLESDIINTNITNDATIILNGKKTTVSLKLANSNSVYFNLERASLTDYLFISLEGSNKGNYQVELKDDQLVVTANSEANYGDVLYVMFCSKNTPNEVLFRRKIVNSYGGKKANRSFNNSNHNDKTVESEEKQNTNEILDSPKNERQATNNSDNSDKIVTTNQQTDSKSINDSSREVEHNLVDSQEVQTSGDLKSNDNEKASEVELKKTKKLLK